VAKSSKGKSTSKAAAAKTGVSGSRSARRSVANPTAARSATTRKSSTSRKQTLARDPKSSTRSGRRANLRLVAEAERLERLIGELGNNRVANLLAVSPSQPSRWRSGKEGIGIENQRKLIDLDYVFGRLEQLFTSRQAEIWLTSYNAHLGGRPIDVLRLKGVPSVIAAIDAEAQGAFA
jgi:Protein of unknown function (DUF2384)